MRKIFRLALLVLVLALIVAQFFPPDRTNPQVNPGATFEAVAKASPEAARVFQRACYDCHSNTTIWPWYSRVAPVSWLLADDVRKGRAHVNFSEWANYGPDMASEKLKDACAEVKAGEMPLWFYRIVHSQSRLSEEDVNAICGAVGKTVSTDGKE